jgi:hypothetical protein
MPHSLSRHRDVPLAVTLLALGLALSLAACAGEGDSQRAPTGLSTRTPTPRVTPTVTPTAVPAAPATPSAPRTPAPGATPDIEADAVAERLAALGQGEDPRVVMQALVIVAPRCQEDRETFADLLERGWRILNEQRGIAIPVSAMLARIAFELPPGTERFNCESLLAAVIVDVSR